MPHRRHLAGEQAAMCAETLLRLPWYFLADSQSQPWQPKEGQGSTKFQDLNWKWKVRGLKLLF